MSDPALPLAKAVDAPSGAADVGEKGDGKKFLRFIPCNPLISLDSDERIQGNPNKSNPIIGGFFDKAAIGQENPNGLSRDLCYGLSNDYFILLNGVALG
jgi:hypothetical protein